MRTFEEVLIGKIVAQIVCPVCSAAVRAVDNCAEPSFRNPDDKAAAAFRCGSEFSVTQDNQIVCRSPCPDQAHFAASDLEERATEEFEQQADEAGQ